MPFETPQSPRRGGDKGRLRARRSTGAHPDSAPKPARSGSGDKVAHSDSTARRAGAATHGTKPAKPPTPRRKLSPGESPFSEAMLTPVFPYEVPNIMKPEAIEKNHPLLLTATRLETQFDRALGRRLLALQEGDRFHRLGFARCSDYVRERMGVSPRWAQMLVRLARELDKLPQLAQAHACGDLTTSKVLSLLGVVNPENEATWASRAQNMTVRKLKQTVRAERKRQGEPAQNEIEADYEPEASVNLCIKAPAPVAHSHDYCVDLVRRVSGSQGPQRTCFEFMLAEYVSGVAPSHADRHPVSADDSAPEPASDIGPRPRTQSGDTSPSGPTPGLRPRTQSDKTKEFLEKELNQWSYLPKEPIHYYIDTEFTGDKDPDPITDPFELDRMIRRLIRMRNTRHADMAVLLYNFSKIGLPRSGGFLSFHHYCTDGLGISARMAQDLLTTYRRLQWFPHLRKAYFEGRLTWSKTRLVASICREGTEEAWIERACKVTVRRLELEVSWSHRKRDENLGGWYKDGGPPPLSFLPPRAEDSAVRPGFGLWEDSNTAHMFSPPGTPDQTDGDPAHTFSHHSPPGSPKNGVAHTFSHFLDDLPCAIRLNISPGVASLWYEARRLSEIQAERILKPWETLFIVQKHFLEVWDDHRQARLASEHKILERDGWQCAVPGCSSRRSLEVHHIKPRAQGGSDDPSNLLTICSTHHRGIIHEKRMLCKGEAPDKVIFTFAASCGFKESMHRAKNKIKPIEYRGDVRIRTE